MRELIEVRSASNGIIDDAIIEFNLMNITEIDGQDSTNQASMLNRIQGVSVLI